MPGNGPRELAATALFGYELAPSGVPEPPAPGEVYADDVLRADGIEVGMEILLGAARSPVTVIGFVSDVSYSGQGSLWAEPGTWREVMAANRPDVRLPDDVVPGARRASRRRRRRRATGRRDRRCHRRGVESLTITDAIEEIPGVRAAAVDVQPDHRCDDRDRGRGGGVVLRLTHRRAARPVRGAQGARRPQQHAVRRTSSPKPSSSRPWRRWSPEASRS